MSPADRMELAVWRAMASTGVIRDMREEAKAIAESILEWVKKRDVWEEQCKTEGTS